MNLRAQPKPLTDPAAPSRSGGRERAAADGIGQASLLRRVNERAVFDLLLTRPQWTRGEITRRLGLTTPTVHKAIARLEAAGLVCEVVAPASTREKSLGGRRSAQYSIGVAGARVVGIAISPGTLRWTCATLDGAPSYVRNATGPLLSTYEGLLGLIASEIKIASSNGSRVVAVGVSVKALVDLDRAIVLEAQGLEQLIGKPLATDLEARVGVPVLAYSDAAGWAFDTLATEPASAPRDFFTLSIGEQVRASVVCDGRVLGGALASGGVLGHMKADGHDQLCSCGASGCLNVTATEPAIAARVSQLLGRAVSFEELICSPKLHARVINQALTATRGSLADALATTIRLLRPQSVLIASRLFDLQANGFTALETAVVARLGEGLARTCTMKRIAGDDLRGAVAGAVRHFREHLGPKIPTTSSI